MNGEVRVEIFHTHLLRGSLVAVHNELSRVDSQNFFGWAQHVQELTANGRKVLLTYDGYRANMTVGALDLFENKKYNRLRDTCAHIRQVATMRRCDIRRVQEGV